jgi:hypothetical protein
MSAAGLLKLLNSGLQDERLLPPQGQPRLDLFQTVFQKAGRFTTELYRVDFDNRPSFGTTARATLPRRGHLITRAFLVATLPDILTPQQQAAAWCTANERTFLGPYFGWTNSTGHALVNQAQVTIAAAPIDTINSRLLEVLDEFHTPLEKVPVVNRMINRKEANFTPVQTDTANKQVIVPLPFWFNRGDPSAALPIDAIGADQVQIAITFNTVANIYATSQRVFNAQGQVANGPIDSSPFYYRDSGSSSQIPGLNGNPADAQKASKVPGITMPALTSLQLQDSYLLLEYIYLDKPEANRLRLGDLSYPIVQHYEINPFDTNGAAEIRIPIRVPNPARDMYFFCHRSEADGLNAPFLATRDLSGCSTGLVAPWWPDASLTNLMPAYSVEESEPVKGVRLNYEGKLSRLDLQSPALLRSLLPAYEQIKSPWHNKYYYHYPFGTQHEFFGITQHSGEANLDKLTRIELILNLNPNRGSVRENDVPSYTVYVWFETYNILRVYGGRAGLLFNY